MKVNYLIRLDDACTTMNRQKWNRIEIILDKFNIRPLVGVIPANDDTAQKIDPEDCYFWNKVKNWERKGWDIALHGYNHVYISTDAGINPLWARSEFAGVPLDIQKKKIKDGVEIFRYHNINPKYFFAPSHTYDMNTLQALRECSDIRIISDTIANQPYKWKDFVFIPQLGGNCKNMIIPGTWTFCLHPSTMEDDDFASLEAFIRKNKSKFISFQDLDPSNIKEKSIISSILSFLYFFRRKIQKNKKKLNSHVV